MMSIRNLTKKGNVSSFHRIQRQLSPFHLVPSNQSPYRCMRCIHFSTTITSIPKKEEEEEEIERRRNIQRKRQQEKQYKQQQLTTSSLPYRKRKQQHNRLKGEQGQNKNNGGNQHKGRRYQQQHEFTSFLDVVDERMKKNPSGGGGGWRKTKHVRDAPPPKKMTSIFDVLDHDDFNSTASPPSSIPKKNTQSLPPQTPSFESLQTKSIFDMFPSSSSNSSSTTTTTTAPSLSPNAYNTIQYEEYNSIITQIISSPKFSKRKNKSPHTQEFIQPILDWLLHPEPTCDYNYTPALFSTSSSSSSST
mmetsp:Transcript_21961/g.32316  ORF Transcript_21961/g.32316 Transcript_21961/m.32316 type:complete len:304 (-) Transcript_21961:1107-2018(-)